MPPRRNLPTLSIHSRQPAAAMSSTLLSPSPSNRSSMMPITPPARLHLRNILPLTPDGMPTPPPPPRKPYPWLWQCHSCNTIYRIGCTRRCLVCDHEYCVSTTTQQTRRGKKRRRSNSTCPSEFDYGGWEEWGAWRRKVLGLQITTWAGQKQREQAFVDRKHNCMIDCDFPSQCHHERFRLQEEALEKNLQESPLEGLPSPSPIATVPLGLDDKMPSTVTLEVREIADQNNGQGSPTSPKSPLRQSFFWDEAEDKEGEEVSWWVAGQQQEEIKAETHQKSQSTSGNKDDKTREGTPLILEDRNAKPLYNAMEDKDIARRAIKCSKRSRCRSRNSSREHPKHRSRLTVRNFTKADGWEDWEDSSDSDSDDSSVASFSSFSSSSSSDGEWLPASDLTSACSSEASSTTDAEESEEEEVDQELRELIKVSNSFLQS